MYQERSYIGKGRIFLQPYDQSSAMLQIGNCSKLELAFDEEKKAQKDYTSPGGGNANVLVAISSVTASIVNHSITAESMAIGLRGSVSYQTASGVIDESQAVLGVDEEMVPFNFIPDASIAYAVKDNAAVVSYVKGVDYVENGNGIQIKAGGSIGAETLKISYTKAASEVLEALTASGGEYRLFFDGLNEAQSGKAVAIRMHRVKPSPTSGLGLIGDEFAELPLELELLSDTAISGAGISKFLKISMAI